jgi:predicted dehydrogenase
MLAASAGIGGFTFLPARVLGRGGAIAPSDKLNIAFIGVGCRGEISVSELVSQNFVAFCDVDWRPIPNYKHKRAVEVIERFPKVPRYDDWRIMLQEQEKNIDAVVVATPDHSHAIAAITAMKMGKHVYCEKPLSHSFAEARAMMEAEKKYKVTAQCGNQGHSSEDCIMVVEWVRSGAIGDVKEAHIFLRTGTLGVAGRSADTEVPYAEIPKIISAKNPVPEGLNWDLWLGPAPYRGYNERYLPNKWRRWNDFGGGMMSDYNCHFMDPLCWALDLGMPERVEANPEAGYDWTKNKETFPNAAEICWDFPARGKKPPVRVVWHYGENTGMIPLPMGWKKGDKLPGAGGAILYGSKGTIVVGPVYASLPRTASTGEYKPISWGTPEKVSLYPAELDKNYKRPVKTLPRPFSHWMDWVESAKARKPAGSNFAYGGLLTQIGHLGNIASRLKGQALCYDAKAGKFTNSDEANSMFERPYREGWKLPS